MPFDIFFIFNKNLLPVEVSIGKPRLYVNEMLAAKYCVGDACRQE